MAKTTHYEKSNKELDTRHCERLIYRLAKSCRRQAEEKFREINDEHGKLLVDYRKGKPLDLVLSTNLVIRTVSKYSIAFYSVLVGDQILEINDIAPMGIPEFLSVMHAEQSVVSCIVF
ncbi:hypothetical protein Y032_0252g229 [Ancylostoma ceylanicum]|uniref:PDZ domain-containing protein n=1 Tax=Ancylostoma ceylanicum TaxID=53326 RepID=A0A016SCM4_9BILA|nr:hypothetical protein Y032_0252g229 [Ancylostoma ceylanicum]